MTITKKQIFIKDYKNIFLTLSNLWITITIYNWIIEGQVNGHVLLSIFLKDKTVLFEVFLDSYKNKTELKIVRS